MKSPFQNDEGYWVCPWCSDAWPPEIPFIMWEEEPFQLFTRHIVTHSTEMKCDIETFLLALQAYRPQPKYWKYR